MESYLMNTLLECGFIYNINSNSCNFSYMDDNKHFNKDFFRHLNFFKYKRILR